jgi:phage repressor protein C with HTH and peptisase S24 domain
MPREWLREMLKQHGRGTKTRLAAALGVSPSVISKMLGAGKEQREITAADLLAMEAFFGSRPGPVTKVVGYVGAGAAVIPIDAEEMDEVPAPTSQYPVEAVVVRGYSMYPVYEDGELLFYEVRHVDLADMVGKNAVVKLEDGRMLVKKLRRGSEPGLWTLESIAAPLIENVAIEWAAPVRWRELR